MARTKRHRTRKLSIGEHSHPLTLRISDELNQALDRATEKSQRMKADEVRSRLEDTIRLDEVLGHRLDLDDVMHVVRWAIIVQRATIAAGESSRLWRENAEGLSFVQDESLIFDKVRAMADNRRKSCELKLRLRSELHRDLVQSARANEQSLNDEIVGHIEAGVNVFAIGLGAVSQFASYVAAIRDGLSNAGVDPERWREFAALIAFPVHQREHGRIFDALDREVSSTLAAAVSRPPAVRLIKPSGDDAA